MQRLKHSTSRDPVKKAQKQAAIREAYRDYMAMAEALLTQAAYTRMPSPGSDPSDIVLQEELDRYMNHARRQIDQIHRRVILGETIPHGEKVFSLFEPHTEWINKGKAGVPVELGLRVCIMEDHHRFILHHQVMERSTDEQVAIAMVEETQKRFSGLRAVSMDKGFHSPANQESLKTMLECVVLPKKGRRNQAEQARESEAEFVHLRKQHSAVESAINALEVHGLDKCPDHGMDGFKRYVAWAVVSRNIQRLGAVLRQQAREKEARKRGAYKKAA